MNDCLHFTTPELPPLRPSCLPTSFITINFALNVRWFYTDALNGLYSKDLLDLLDYGLGLLVRLVMLGKHRGTLSVNDDIAASPIGKYWVERS